MVIADQIYVGHTSYGPILLWPTSHASYVTKVFSAFLLGNFSLQPTSHALLFYAHVSSENFAELV